MRVCVAALRKGLKESFGGALQNLLSSYTNLAAGIMILWYGGIVVLNDGPLSVGNLITFRELHADRATPPPTPPLSASCVCTELYWNMIRGNCASAPAPFALPAAVP